MNSTDLSPRDMATPSSIDFTFVGEQGRARVLIVDDDERNLMALQTVLEDIADVVLAKSGDEALRHLLKGEFAVILLDVYMPGLDGYETAKIVRAREQTKRIPIVFLSAVNKETEHLIRGYSMGAVDYVFKPVEPIVLRSKVAVFVDLYQMTRETKRKAMQTQALLDENLRAHAELVRTERELRQAEHRQAAIHNSLPILLYVEEVCSLKNLKFVGGDFQSVTGFRFDELMTLPTLWYDRIHPEDRGRVHAERAARKESRGYAIEYRWEGADGRYRDFLDQAVLLESGSDRAAEYVGTLLDISDRRELESQLLHARKMDAVGQLSGGIAHDFNNLLAAVLAGLELLELRAELAPDHRRILDMTRHAAQQGADVVSRLLAFARKQALRPSTIEISALSAAVNEVLIHTLGGLVVLEWQLASDLWRPFADAGQLEMSLMNLAINARDAMPQGGTIRISAHNSRVVDGDATSLPSGDYVVIAVSDTGHGISPAELEKVTEPFFTTKAAGKGTGLGLSMVYGFIKQSGGALHIRSELEQGTSVSLWLPRAPAAVTTSVLVHAATVDHTASVPLRILLVDDNDDVRAMTAALLTELGHNVTTASSGACAMEVLVEGARHIDILVSDYAMPHMSGAELIKRARQSDTNLPAVIITGYVEADAIEDVPTDVVIVPKPFTPIQLQTAMAIARGGKDKVHQAHSGDTVVS